jgi:hypothetical protein
MSHNCRGEKNEKVTFSEAPEKKKIKVGAFQFLKYPVKDYHYFLDGKGSMVTVRRRGLVKRFIGIFVNLYRGYVSGYSMCCILYYIRLDFADLPAALSDWRLKGKSGGFSHVLCDECYFNLTKDVVV